MPLAFVLKSTVGLIFLFIYSQHYGNGELSEDAGVYMRESKMLFDVFKISKTHYFSLLFGLNDSQELVYSYLGNTTHWDAGTQALFYDNRNILRFHSLVHFFSFNNPIVHMLVMCFISLMGIKHIFIGIEKRTRLRSSYLFWGLLLIPSMLFWTSSILKEPLLLFGLGLLIRGLLGENKLYKKMLFLLFAFILLLMIKQYVIILLIPSFIFFFIHSKLNHFKIGGGLLSLVGLIVIFLILFPSIKDKSVRLLARKQFDFINVARGGLHASNNGDFYYFRTDQMEKLKVSKDSVRITKPVNALLIKHGDIKNPKQIYLQPTDVNWPIYFQNERSDGFIDLSLIDDSFGQLLKNIPEALINSLFRPFIWDPGGNLKYPAVVETILIVGFFGFAIRRRRKLDDNEKGIITAILLFVLFLCLFIGWTTPVLGAIVRYRIPAYLGLILVGFIYINPPILFVNEKK